MLYFKPSDDISHILSLLCFFSCSKYRSGESACVQKGYAVILIISSIKLLLYLLLTNHHLKGGGQSLSYERETIGVSFCCCCTHITWCFVYFIFMFFLFFLIHKEWTCWLVWFHWCVRAFQMRTLLLVAMVTNELISRRWSNGYICMHITLINRVIITRIRIIAREHEN